MPCIAMLGANFSNSAKVDGSYKTSLVKDLLPLRKTVFEKYAASGLSEAGIASFSLPVKGEKSTLTYEGWTQGAKGYKIVYKSINKNSKAEQDGGPELMEINMRRKDNGTKEFVYKLTNCRGLFASLGLNCKDCNVKCSGSMTLRDKGDKTRDLVFNTKLAQEQWCLDVKVHPLNPYFKLSFKMKLGCGAIAAEAGTEEKQPQLHADVSGKFRVPRSPVTLAADAKLRPDMKDSMMAGGVCVDYKDMSVSLVANCKQQLGAFVGYKYGKVITGLELGYDLNKHTVSEAVGITAPVAGYGTIQAKVNKDMIVGVQFKTDVGESAKLTIGAHIDANKAKEGLSCDTSCLGGFGLKIAFSA